MKSRMVAVTVHLPRAYVDLLDKLVEARLYPNRCEAIRMAVRNLIFEEYVRLAGVPREWEQG